MLTLRLARGGNNAAPLRAGSFALTLNLAHPFVILALWRGRNQARAEHALPLLAKGGTDPTLTLPLSRGGNSRYGMVSRFAHDCDIRLRPHANTPLGKGRERRHLPPFPRGRHNGNPFPLPFGSALDPLPNSPLLRRGSNVDPSFSSPRERRDGMLPLFTRGREGVG